MVGGLGADEVRGAEVISEDAVRCSETGYVETK